MKNIRQGEGTLISPIKTLVFKGYFHQGLPVTEDKTIARINTALVDTLQSGVRLELED